MSNTTAKTKRKPKQKTSRNPSKKPEKKKTPEMRFRSQCGKMAKYFRRNVKSALKAMGCSQSDLARELGVDKTQICHQLKGGHEPTLTTVERWSIGLLNLSKRNNRQLAKTELKSLRERLKPGALLEYSR